MYYGCANPSNAKLVLNGNWEYPYQWCPTELDNEGKYVSGKWGYCMDYDAEWLPDACDPVVQSGKNGSLIFPIFSSYVYV